MATQKQNKKGFIGIFGLIIFILFLCGIIFMLFSDKFEKNKPIVIAPSNTAWNLQNNFFIYLEDDTGIKDYQIFYKNDQEKIPLLTALSGLEECEFIATDKMNNKGICLGLQPPNLPSKNLQTLNLDIQITDLSRANLFKGNTTSTSLSLNIDTQKPQINILAHSYKITQGGSALVIFRVMDKHLKNITISNGVDQFNAHPFYKEEYYISLLAWPKNNQNFNAQIHANDSAGNKSIVPIKFVITPKTYKSSNISINDSFIDGKLSNLVEEIGERQLTSFNDKSSIFKYINEEIRHKSIKRIQESLSNLPQEKIDNFKIYPFYPLKNGAVMASFGDSRTFFYKGESISQSHHMGLDLASIKQAPIIASNTGKVILNEFVGINGNTLVLYHGLGLSSLYSHLAESTVQLGEEIQKGSIIAIQGNTGLAFGDHLHFGILVQGHEVWTAEWMDSNWIKNNITTIIAQAKEIIDRI